MTEEQKKLVEENLALVKHVAKKYENISKLLTNEDLFQIGCEGLIHAVIRFDSSLGYKFSSYAHCCIEGYIKREIDNKDRMIKIPSYASALIRNWKNSNTEEFCDLKEYAKANGHLGDYMFSAYQAMKPVISLDQPIMHCDEWTELKHLIEDDNAENESAVFFRQVSNQIFDLLKEDSYILTEKQKDVLKRRYGFEGEPQTLQEIATEYGITRERVRQIEAKALRRLRTYSKSLNLDSCLDICNEYDFSNYA